MGDMKKAPVTPSTRLRSAAPALRATTPATKTKTKAKASTTLPESAAPEPTDAEIAVRAYEISLGRDGDGDPVADWLQA